jgi:hypothetical protein
MEVHDPSAANLPKDAIEKLAEIEELLSIPRRLSKTKLKNCWRSTIVLAICQFSEGRWLISLTLFVIIAVSSPNWLGSVRITSCAYVIV